MTTPVDGEVDAELVRLARALGVPPATLDYLAPAGAEALRAVRPRVLDRLYEGEDGLLHRIAAASRLVPNAINSHITPKAVPPMLAAALVSTIEPQRALKIAAKLPPDYLADCATVMDPRKIGRLVPLLPLELMVTVTRRLMERGEYVAMGSLVTELSDEQIRSLLPHVSDDDIRKLARQVEDKAQLPRLIALVADRVPDLAE